ncbi:MAG: ABC transporter substrate-binding protein, partial [Candidatus Nanopelagicales bacterium]|nr:ABC transporter substrate-binding protein [Candidatus Nanopelagicales bacterium]
NCIAVKHLFEEHGVPTINFPGTTKSRGEYGFHYQLGALYEDGPVIVRALVAKGLTSISVIRDKSPVGNEYYEYFVDACDRLGVTITADVKISPIATDLSAAVTTAKAVNPQALVYLGFGAVLLEMSRELQRQSWDLPRFTTTAGLHFYSKAPQEKEVMSGWAFVDMVDEDNLELQHVVREMKARYGMDAFSTTFGCLYDMATLVVLGLYYAPVYTPEGMKEGLERIHHIPAALGAQGTVMGFGPHERTALKGPDYLVLRQMQGQVTVRYS